MVKLPFRISLCYKKNKYLMIYQILPHNHYFLLILSSCFSLKNKVFYSSILVYKGTE